MRDWLYVEDHCRAIDLVVRRGRPGATYCVGGRNEIANLAVVETLCDLLDQLRPGPGGPRRRLIKFVTDRPGHDFRYAIDCSHLERELGWQPCETWQTGFRRTVAWYLDHPQWISMVQQGYQGQRLGLKA